MQNPIYFLFFIIILINIIAHMILIIINSLKIDQTYPVLFKIWTYFIVLNFNIMITAILLFTQNMLNVGNIGFYTAITATIFLLHFIIDEDIILRFEKSVNFIIILLVSLVAYSTYTFILI